MDIIRNYYTFIRIALVKKEHEKVYNDNENIAQLYDFIAGLDAEKDKKIYNAEIYLLLTEYISKEDCPVMREGIKTKLNWRDSYEPEEIKDLDFIRMSNYEVLRILYENDAYFRTAYEKAEPKYPVDEKLLSFLKSIKKNYEIC